VRTHCLNSGLTKVCLNMQMEVACGPHGAVKGLSANNCQLPRRCIQVLDKGMCQAQLLQLDDEENHNELAVKRVVKQAKKAGNLSKVRGGGKFPSVRVLWKHSRQPQMHEVRFS
jgi:hypothetical protein